MTKQLTQSEKAAKKIKELQDKKNAALAFHDNMNQTGTETTEEKKSEELVAETTAMVQGKQTPVSSDPEQVSDVKPAPVETKQQEKTSGRQKQIKEQEKQESEKTVVEEVKEVKSESKSSLLQELKAKSKKKRIEDTHSRCTFLVRKDLESRINGYADGNFGFKTSFINYAIEAALEDYDKIYSEDEE